MEKDNRIKVLWISDMVTPTGFSRVAHSILKFLSPEEYEVRAIGVNYRGDPHPYNYPIFPAMLGGDVYGVNRIGNVVEYWTPDIIFLLNDAWIIRSYLKEIKRLYEGKSLPKIVVYTPIDAEDHSPAWYKEFNIVEKVVTYTEFGKKVLKKAVPLMQVDIIEHGVDHEDFFKFEGVDKRTIKAQIYPEREDFLDSWIVLNANRNQPRKRLDITMKGFAEFARGKPDNVKLYMHCGRIDQHIDILEFSDRLGLAERLIVTNTNNGAQQVPTSLVNLIYNATEVGINTGIGEGWGLPNFEQASIGIPQIVPGHSALKELYSDCGYVIEPKFTWTQDNIMTMGRVVTPEDVATALEDLYTNKDLYDDLSKKCMEKFSRPEYSWEVIAGKWDKMFKELCR